MMFFDLVEPSQIVEIAEPLFLNLNAADEREQPFAVVGEGSCERQAVRGVVGAEGDGNILALTQEVGHYLSSVLDLLDTPDIKKSFDANTKWDVIEIVSNRHLGGARELSQRTKMAESGRRALQYIADNEFKTGVNPVNFQLENPGGRLALGSLDCGLSPYSQERIVGAHRFAMLPHPAGQRREIVANGLASDIDSYCSKILLPSPDDRPPRERVRAIDIAHALAPRRERLDHHAGSTLFSNGTQNPVPPGTLRLVKRAILAIRQRASPSTRSSSCSMQAASVTRRWLTYPPRRRGNSR